MPTGDPPEAGGSMSTTTMKARVTSFAPQFLIDDLDRSIATV